MGVWEFLPYTNMQDANLGILIRGLRQIAEEFEDFKAVNKLSYSGTWYISKNYSPWDIVEDNNRGYIAIKPVPPGVPITDTNYWREVANFTELYSNLGQEILAINQELEQINNLLDNQDIIDNPIAVWIGDSYTAAGSLGANQNRRFSTLVSNAIGYTEKNYAVGGCGYIEGPTPYSVQAANAISDFTSNSIDPLRVRKVFICGMRNDGGSYGTSTYGQAVNACINPLSTFFTKAEIIIIPDLFDWKCMPVSYLRNVNTIKSYAEDYLQTRVIDKAYEWLIGMANHVLYQNGADVHPDVYGHKVIAEHILSALNGNNYSHSDHYVFTPTTVGNGITNCKCELTVNNSIAHFRCTFNCDNIGALTSSNLFTFTFDSLSLRSLYFLRDTFFATLNGRTMNYPGLVTIRQIINKTSDTDGSLSMNAYLFKNGNYMSDNSTYIIDFSIPYGLQYTELQIT